MKYGLIHLHTKIVAQVWRGWKVAGFLLMGSMMVGCQGSRVLHAPGSTSLTRHTWWNAYKQGIALERLGKYEEALPYFTYCLGWRYGYAQERWRVRTYGLHVMDNYFPFRESGICFYHQGEYGKALEYLTRSVDILPSGRAMHYLNLTNRARLTGTSPARPVIKLRDMNEQAFVTNHIMRLAFQVEAEGLVDQISINGKPIFNELAEVTESIEQEIILNPGANRVTISATDLLGNTTQHGIIFIADFEAPSMMFEQAVATKEGFDVTVHCYDEGGVDQISFGSSNLFKAASSSAGVDMQAVTFSVSSNTVGALVARDVAGHEAVFRLDAEGLDEWLVSSGLTIRYRGQAAPLSKEKEPVHPVGPQEYHVFVPSFYLDGWARDTKGIRQIRVNGKAELTKVREQTSAVYFNTHLPLVLGTNRVEVVVINQEGETSRKQIHVVRHEPEYTWDEIRLRVVLQPFHSEASTLNGSVLKARLGEALQTRPVRFYVLNRDPRAVTSVERERWLSQLDQLTDPRARLRLQAQMEPDLTFDGFVFPYLDGATVRITVGDVHAEKNLLVEDIFIPVEELEQPSRYQMDGLALKLGQQFPVLTGSIVGTAEQLGVVLTSDQVVREGTRFIVAQKDDQGQGHVHKLGARMVEWLVTDATETHLKGKVVPAAARNSISEGDVVYAR